MVEKLRSAGRLVTEENLGFSVNEIGTHSIRSGAAMSLFLGGVQTFSIMMIGRWSSDAFLKYIRKQVEQFTHNSSKRMLEFERFFTTPNFVPMNSSSDTRTRNDRNNFATVRHNGVPNANLRQPFALVSWIYVHVFKDKFIQKERYHRSPLFECGVRAVFFLNLPILCDFQISQNIVFMHIILLNNLLHINLLV